VNKVNKTTPRSRFFASFNYAFSGFRVALQQEINFRVFAVVAVVVLVSAFLLEVSMEEWMVLIVVIGLNLMAELFNTALELLCDRVSSKKDPAIHAIKDISAAAVLVFVITAVVVGWLIFLPKLLEL
jgi:diacylglycerol kinase